MNPLDRIQQLTEERDTWQARCAKNERAFLEVESELAALRRTRATDSCQCGDDEACRFARERDEARAELAALRRDKARLAAAAVYTRDDTLGEDETGSYSFIPLLEEGDVCYVVRDPARKFAEGGANRE